MDQQSAAGQQSGEPTKDTLPHRLSVRVGDIFDPGDFKFRVLGISKGMLVIKPEGGYFVTSGRSRDKERRRHK